MKKYTLVGPHKIEIQEAPIPQLDADEVLIKVKYIGICGSDIHLYHGTYGGPFSYPMLFGHEWSGVIEKVGSEVTEFAPGDLVTGDCSQYCGTCDNCRIDPNVCDTVEKFGITMDGATADYIVRKSMYVYKAPVGVSDKQLALTEPVAVAASLIKKIKRIAQDLSGKKVLVFGGGPIGLAAALLLRYQHDCESIDLYDISQYRCDIAKTLGVNVPTAEYLQPQTNTDYGSMYASAKYDVILEMTGNAVVFNQALQLAKPNGIIGCIGMLPSVTIEQKLIVTKCLTLVGSIGGTGSFPEAMQLIQSRPDEVRKLISHVVDIEKVESAFDLIEASEGTMKILLRV